MRTFPPFGWTWIGRSLLLRRGSVLVIAVMTAIIYLAGLGFPIATQMIVDTIVSRGADPMLILLGVAALLAIAVEAFVTHWRQKLVIDLGGFLDQRIARHVFAHLMRVRVDGAGFRAGETLNHFQQVVKIRDFALFRVPNTVFDAGAAVVSLALAFYYDPVVGLALVVACPLVAWTARKQVGGFGTAMEAHYLSINARQNVLSETVNGLGTVKALALEAERMRRWNAVTARMLANLRGIMDMNRHLMVRAQIASRGLTVLVVGLGCWRLLEGELTIGGLLALQLVAGRVTGTVLMSGALYEGFKEVDVALKQVRAFLAQPREAARMHPPARSFAAGSIALSRVSLTYPGREQPALHKISLTLPERGVVALVGRNGSGKSTLVRLLIGLQREYEGTVTIGGRDLRDYDPRWLRGRIGIVDQDTVLFSGTIRDNLAGGARADDAALREALRFAGALDFVEALPQGLDTSVTEGGRSLSGGQRQRLSIARAVIRDPAIALFDEPTAFLDAEAAIALEQRLEAWGRQRLTILVTHHLAAARGADRILVLDEGILVGDGTHEQLIVGAPRYASLWADYARSLEQAAG
jgi:ABC-type bacteriocin/lantibiotic exporter with double-glycine peptidase domain